MNEPIWPMSYDQRDEWPIFRLLKGKTSRSFKERIVNYLLGIGIDPMLIDIHSHTAIEMLMFE